MGNLLRRVRGILSMGVVWGVAWAVPMTALFALLGLLIAQPGESRVGLALRLASNGLVAGFLGFATGSLFGLAVAVAERNRSLPGLSTWRFTLLGVLTGSGLAAALVALSPTPFVPATVPYFIGFSGVFGALSAAGVLGLARRGAPPGEPELAGPSSDRGLVYPAMQMPKTERAKESVHTRRSQVEEGR
jgi:hypothetical protein